VLRGSRKSLKNCKIATFPRNLSPLCAAIACKLVYGYQFQNEAFMWLTNSGTQCICITIIDKHRENSRHWKMNTMNVCLGTIAANCTWGWGIVYNDKQGCHQVKELWDGHARRAQRLGLKWGSGQSPLTPPCTKLTGLASV